MNERQLREAIAVLATGDKTSDAVRLRALELIREIPARESATYELLDEVAKLDSATLARDLDVLVAAPILRIASDPRERDEHPESWRALNVVARMISRTRPPLPAWDEGASAREPAIVPEEAVLSPAETAEAEAAVQRAQEAAERKRRRETLLSRRPSSTSRFAANRQSRLRIDS